MFSHLCSNIWYGTSLTYLRNKTGNVYDTTLGLSNVGQSILKLYIYIYIYIYTYTYIIFIWIVAIM